MILSNLDLQMTLTLMQVLVEHKHVEIKLTQIMTFL